jgi:hypothetical protein
MYIFVVRFLIFILLPALVRSFTLLNATLSLHALHSLQLPVVCCLVLALVNSILISGPSAVNPLEECHSW